MKKISILLALMMTFTVFTGCSSPAPTPVEPSGNSEETSGEVASAPGEVFNLKLGHQAPEGEPYDLLANRFKELIEERTEGQIKIEIFPHAQLGYDRALAEALQFDTLDLAVITDAPMGGFVSEVNTLSLPFIFRDWDHTHAFARSEEITDFFNTFEAAGFIPLGALRRGFRSVTNSTRPIYTPEDMKDLKLRVIENPIYVNTFTSLGAAAIPMAWGEVYVALQQGTIDGQENSPEILVSYRLWEVQNYYSLTEHMFAFAFLMASDHTMNRLPVDLQEAVRLAAFDAADEISIQLQEKEAETLVYLESEGFEINQVNNKEDFASKVETVYSEFINSNGSAFVDMIQGIQ